jgi:protocatechuate 3,4-dioxygenase beta subunit
MRWLFFTALALAGWHHGSLSLSAQAPETPVLAGTVVTPDNRPARGTTIWLIGGTYDAPPNIVARRTTDEQGRFAFQEVNQPNDRTPMLRLPMLMARDAQGRIGWSQLFYRRHLPNLEVKLKLQNVNTCRGRVTDAAGKPIASAGIVPLYWNNASFRAPERDSIEVPQELVTEYRTKTNDDGGFVLKSVPTHGGVMVRLHATGFGSPGITFDSGQPVSIRLERAGSVAGALTGAKDLNAAAGVKLAIILRSAHMPGNETALLLHYFTDLTSQKDGTFCFAELPPGRYSISPSLAETLPYYTEPTADFEVKPGSAITGLSIPLLPAVAVRGRVIDKDSGAGIKDVWITLYHPADQGRLIYARRSKTGADGRYTVYVKPGKIMAQAQQGLHGFVPALGGEGYPQVDASKNVDYPDIKLVRTATISGVVMDENGKPAAGAKVHLVTSYGLNGSNQTSPSTTTNAEGKFLFTGADPMDNAPLRARGENAATAAATLIGPENLAKPVRLVLSPKNASRLHGTIVDQAGQPIRGALVGVEWHFNFQSRRWPGSGSSTSLEKHLTNADGHFETKALWPGEPYRVNVSAEGYGKAQSTQVLAKAGQVHDLQQIILQRTGGVVQGQIVDSRGQPIRGAQVFNNGDGPQPVQDQSDASGRFRLDDLFTGGVYVCARKSGYRFTAKHVVTDGPNVTIQLLRKDEPIPKLESRAPAPTFEEQRQVARKLLEKLWALPMEQKRTGMRTILESMARLDPARALRWAKEAGGRWENTVRTTVAERIAESDVDEALALLAQVDNDSGYYALKGLTEQYLKTDVAKALRFAEEAAVQARTREQPARTWSLAEIGNLVRQLGKEDVGRKLIDEAASMADKLGAQQHQALARGMTAQALAPYDLDRARRLLEPLTDSNDRIRYALMVASATMKDDPSLLPRARMQIAYRLAASDPAAAFRIVDSIRGDAKTRAEAFAWVAVAVAPKDQKLAISLIDRSLAIYVDEPEEFRQWSSWGAPSVFAARVAGQAHEIGYPDMDSVIARVLAVRQIDRYESPARVTESHAATALILALTDATTAKQILRSIEPRNAVIGTGYSSIRRQLWLPAWALADLHHAGELFDRELASFKEKATIDLQDNGMTRMVEILTIPPEERPRRLLRSYGAFWFPGEE